MTTISTLRRGAGLAIGSTALALTLAACGGGGSVKTADPTTVDATTSAAAPAATTSDAPDATTSAPATSDAPAAAGEVTDADLTAAKQRFIDFVKAGANKDGKGACSVMLDPTASTPTPIAPGPLLDGCAQGIESEADSMGITPEQAAAITPDMLDATAQPDGSVKVSMGGSEFPYPLVRADDGNWYIDAKGAL